MVVRHRGSLVRIPASNRTRMRNPQINAAFSRHGKTNHNPDGNAACSTIGVHAIAVSASTKKQKPRSNKISSAKAAFSGEVL